MIDLKALLLSALLPAMALIHANWDPPKMTISQAMATAQSEQRQLMLYFTSAACKDCGDTDAYFSREDVHKALSDKFVTVIVNIEDFDGRACSEIYEVDGVPAMVIVEPTGEVTFKRNGDLRTTDVESIITSGSLPNVKSTPEKNIRTSSNVEVHSEAGTTGHISIQVGFFSSMENAQRLAGKIESKGFQRPAIEEEIRDGKTFYRVLVGSYPNSKVAQQDMDELRGSGYSVKVHTAEE